jgi:hypothetical protein
VNRKTVRCSSGKVGYRQHDAVLQAIARVLPTAGRFFLRSYACEECLEWHITSHAPKRMRGRTELKGIV